MRYLEERLIGFDVGVTRVPLVCQSSLFDLTVGDCAVRPDVHMAYAAYVAQKVGWGRVTRSGHRYPPSELDVRLSMHPALHNVLLL